MLNYVNVASYQKSLDTGPRRSIIGLVFQDSSTITVEARYLARMGILGVLPLAKYSTGDTLALRALPGLPIERWPVVYVSHIGEGCRTIASRPSRVMATVILLDHPLHDQQSLKTFNEPILEFSRWLGDEDLTRTVLDRLRDDTHEGVTPLPELPLRAADPDSTMAVFQDVYARLGTEKADAEVLWREVVQNDAEFAPAQMLLLHALLTGSDYAAIQQSAWDVLTLNHVYDNTTMVTEVRQPPYGWNDRNPVFVAAQTLVGLGMPDSADALHAVFLPVAKALAAGEESYDGGPHLEAARALAALRHYDLAWIACQNAAYWRGVSQEAAFPEALDVALDIARAWKQKDLTDTLLLMQPETKLPARRADEARPAFTLPREYEASEEVTQAIFRLSTEDLFLASGDFLLVHRYGRWNFLTQGYPGRIRAIETLAIMNYRKLINFVGGFAAGTLDDLLKPAASFTSDLQNELRYKLRSEIADYHVMMDANLIYIVGGATSDQMSTLQASEQQHYDLTEKILTGGGGGWFKFTSEWQDIADLLDASS